MPEHKQGWWEGAALTPCRRLDQTHPLRLPVASPWKASTWGLKTAAAPWLGPGVW